MPNCQPSRQSESRCKPSTRNATFVRAAVEYIVNAESAAPAPPSAVVDTTPPSLNRLKLVNAGRRRGARYRQFHRPGTVDGIDPDSSPSRMTRPRDDPAETALASAAVTFRTTGVPLPSVDDRKPM